MPTTSASDDFLRKQEEIYENSFRAKVPEVLRSGIIPDPALAESHGGFFAYYKHGKEISRKIAAAASRIAEIVPCVVYTPEMVHTTMCTFGVRPGRVVNLEDSEDKDILEKFKWAVNFPIDWLDHVPAPTFTYSGFLVNRTTVIACGTPTLPFEMETKIVLARLKEKGLEVRPPWGGHITVARFTKDIIDRDTLEHLVRTVGEMEASGETSIKESPSLRPGFFYCSPDSFKITAYK